MKRSWSEKSFQRLFQGFDRLILQKVLFIGGRSHFPSVRIRCIEIAKAIGCDYVTDLNSISDISSDKEIFICIKPLLSEESLEKLQKRGIVIWDIHDNYCPRHFVDYYLVSSKGAYQKFCSYGKTYLIPHHHCNFSGFPNPRQLPKKPTWIGSLEWVPRDLPFDFDVYNSKQMTTQDVSNIYARSSILLNLRSSVSRTSESLSEHIRINPGIKLINSIGFGVPSISNPEPAYLEIGPECTIVVNSNEDCKNWVARLQEDDNLYNQLRNNCILKAHQYSLSAIAIKYLDFLTCKI